MTRFEKPCEWCGGGKLGRCYSCDNRGAVPNEFGQELLDFLRHHMRDNGELTHLLADSLDDRFEIKNDNSWT